MTRIVYNAPVSSTPDSVMGEVTDNICKQWDIDDVYQALPNSLSYDHASYAMPWGEPFLILLSKLAGLTPGKLKEVQARLRKRIDRGRKEKKCSRQSWAMPADLKALISHYRHVRNKTAKPANEESEDQAPGNGEQYTSKHPRRSARTRNTKGMITTHEQDQDEDYVPSSRSDLSRRGAASATAAGSAKRKRSQNSDADESYAPTTPKEARGPTRDARGLIPASVVPVYVMVIEEPVADSLDDDEQQITINGLQARGDRE